MAISWVDEFPNLVAEYDIEKNKVPLRYLSRKSVEKVWWRCTDYGRSYEAVAYKIIIEVILLVKV